MGACICLMEDLHLTMKVSMFLASSHAVGHGLVDLVAGIDDHLYILLL